MIHWRTLLGAAAILAAAPLASAQVPIIETRYGPAVTVTIGEEDAQEYTLLLDTGAGVTVLDAASADGLALTLLQEVNVGSNTGTRTRAGMYRAGVLAVGDDGAENVQLLVLDLAAQGGPFVDGIDGILSPNMFAPALVGIDFEAGTLRLYESDIRLDNLAQTYSESGLPMTRIEIAGTEYDAQIDTGASSLLTAPTGLADTLPLLAPPRQTATIATVNDTADVLSATLDGDVNIAGKVFPNPDIDFVEGAESILLGMDALEGATIVLDPALGRVLLLCPTAQ